MLEAAEAEDPLAALSPLVAVAPVVGVELVPPVAVAVAAGPLHTIDLGILGKVDATDVGVYVPDVVNRWAVLMYFSQLERIASKAPLCMLEENSQ